MNIMHLRKTIFIYMSLICVLTALYSCSSNMTDKDEIIDLFNKKEKLFLDAAKSNDYRKVSKVAVCKM